MDTTNSTQWRSAIEDKRKEIIDIAFWDDVRKLLASPPASMTSSKIEVDFGDTVRIGRKEDLRPDDLVKVQTLVKALFPWRKGPFSLFGLDIDAEWRSYLKWERILPHLPSISGKRVLDIGCNNGYYMFRVAQHKPQFVLGIDPNARYYFQFTLVNHYAGFDNLQMEPVGIEELSFLVSKFDLVFFLGVLYHRRDPIESLHVVKDSLTEGGTLIIESLTVPGDEKYVLKPESRYSKMRNVWEIPSEACLERWLSEVGFRNISLISTHTTDTYEQRRTELAPFESLSDFLDPKDATQTVEGYPAPRRSIFRCEK